MVRRHRAHCAVGGVGKAAKYAAVSPVTWAARERGSTGLARALLAPPRSPGSSITLHAVLSIKALLLRAAQLLKAPSVMDVKCGVFLRQIHAVGCLDIYTRCGLPRQIELTVKCLTFFYLSTVLHFLSLKLHSVHSERHSWQSNTWITLQRAFVNMAIIVFA